jgi:hypothetical protein
MNKYLVATLELYNDRAAERVDIYISKGNNFKKYWLRLFLLPTGELVLIDYVNYHGARVIVPSDVRDGVCFGVGVPHYATHRYEIQGYNNVLDLASIKNLKEDVLNMKKTIVKMDEVTGCYTLLKGKELADILSGAKGGE